MCDLGCGEGDVVRAVMYRVPKMWTLGMFVTWEVKNVLYASWDVDT